MLPRARMTLPRNQHKVHRSEHKEPTKSKGQEKEHKDQLERLREKDPEFYEFLKEHEKEFLHFNDEDADAHGPSGHVVYIDGAFDLFHAGHRWTECSFCKLVSMMITLFGSQRKSLPNNASTRTKP